MRYVIFYMCFFAKMVFSAFNAADYYGVESYGENKQLLVLENPKLTHAKERFIIVKVKNIDTKKIMPNTRIRLAIWKSSENYAKEDVAPYRASSISANLAAVKENGFLAFKIGIDKDTAQLSFFIHLDVDNKGKVERNFLGIPKDPYMFSSKIAKTGCPGVAREGLSPPKFENTLLDIKQDGQIIEMCF